MSISAINSSSKRRVMVCACCITSSLTSYPFFPTVSRATIVEREEASAPFKAAILPPPGTGSLQATLSKKSFTVKSANMVFCFLSDIPSLTYEYYQNNIKPKPQAVGQTEDGQTICLSRFMQRTIIICLA